LSERASAASRGVGRRRRRDVGVGVRVRVRVRVGVERLRRGDDDVVVERSALRANERRRVRVPPRLRGARRVRFRVRARADFPQPGVRDAREDRARGGRLGICGARERAL
jgi:hypothetical protein